MEAFEFDFKHYIDTLIEQMGYQNASKEQLDELRTNLEKRTSHAVLNALMLNLEPEEFAEITDAIQSDAEPLQTTIIRGIEGSESANKAVATALDDLFNEMVTAAKKLAT